jgi:signal recognition particle receptor subunit beta
MVLFNYSTKELTAKVVYYGPGLCGKTTNLQWIHEKLPIRNKGKMLSLATEADRTLFFDFLPIELGSIRGMKTRIQLYTVPGQVFYNATRRMVLKGADCVVFVADSQEAMLDADLDSLHNLRENLEVNEINPDEIPMVMQYNKRDLPNALPVEILNEKLNPRRLPFFEAVAMKGIGVEETLKGATTLVFKSLAGKYGGAEPLRAGAAAPPPPPAAAAPRPAPAPPAAAPRPAPAPPPPPPPAPPAPREPLDTVALPHEDVSIDAILDDDLGAPAPAASAPAASTDDLLDSLDLGSQPAGAPGVDIDLEDEDSMEELEVLPDELEEPVPVAASRRGSATLMREADESEDLRRRIGRPAAASGLAEEEDEISFDSAPPPRRALDGDTNPGAKTASTPSAAPAPVEIPVEITAPRGQRELTVPIEVTVGRAGAAVHLKLNIALKIRIAD